MRLRLALALLVLSAGGAAAWLRRPGSDAAVDRPDILLITLCSVRADRIGAWGYAAAHTPRIDQLAADGVVFEKAWTTATFTLASHAAMLTGLLPGHVGVTDVADSIPATAPNVPGILQLYSYHTVAYAPVSNHGSFRAGNGSERGFDAFLEGGTLARQRAFVAELSHDPRPWFAVAHFKEAHPPYGSLGPGTDPRVIEWSRRNSDRPAPGEQRRSPDAWMVDQMRADPALDAYLQARYDGAIQRTDEQVAALLDAFAAAGLLEHTIVIVAGDHGESLGENAQIGHQGFLTEEVLQVPLVVWAPGVARPGTRVPDDVSLVDIAPTLLELAGVPAPAHQDGRSLVPLLRGEALPARPALAQSLRGDAAHLTGEDLLVSGPWRLHSYAATGAWRLYRVEEGKRNDVSATELAQGRALAEERRRIAEGSRFTTERAAISPAEAEALRRDGYW